MFFSVFYCFAFFFFFQAEDGIRDFHVTGVQTCALPIFPLGQLGRQLRRGPHGRRRIPGEGLKARRRLADLRPPPRGVREPAARRPALICRPPPAGTLSDASDHASRSRVPARPDRGGPSLTWRSTAARLSPLVPARAGVIPDSTTYGQ